MDLVQGQPPPQFYKMYSIMQKTFNSNSTV